MTAIIRRPIAMFGIGAAFCTVLAAQPAAAQTVTIADGEVQGHVNENTREFLGIPYAAPPVGDLRFSPPTPPAPWATPLVADTYPPGCAQLPVLTNGNIRSDNEDCLYLNVWTPNPLPEKPLPVMIWIHGGSNTSGSISDPIPIGDYPGHLYDGHKLSQTGNVIVVTINYRLNVFGFLGLQEVAAEDPAYPYSGNQGLLDQNFAMKWVKANIAAFGGDPDNVTIFGESAGSFDVCTHVVSPMSAGLFHKAISESGGCTAGVNSLEESHAQADALADEVGCGDAVDRLACMRAVPTADLLDASPVVGLVTEGTNLGMSVDGGFLTEFPIETFNRGELPPIPYILGSNKDEGTLFFIGSPELTPEEYSAALLDRFGAFAAEVEAMYPASDYPSAREALIKLTGDGTLTCSTQDVAKRYSAMKKNKTYLYEFARAPSIPAIDLLDLGAFHGLEISYIFGAAPAPTPADQALGEAMQHYWSAFATKGKPRAKHNAGWPRFKEKSYKLLRLDTPPDKIAGYRQSFCDFWSGYYDTINN